MAETTFLQANRDLQIESPLGKDQLLLTRFEGTEEVSEMFEFRLEMISPEEKIDPTQILGHNVTFFVAAQDGTPRYFNGFVRQFAYCGNHDRGSLYSATVVPWLWFLTKRQDCRIFQDQSVTDIIKEVFNGAGFSDFKLVCNKPHPTRTYCVQYRETDFEFVSRLMEEEGIYYFFTHENGQHTMVISDVKDGYVNAADNEVEFASTLSAFDAADSLLSWQHGHEYISGKFSLDDYDFHQPTAKLDNSDKAAHQLKDNPTMEVYDYPGRYPVTGSPPDDEMKAKEGKDLLDFRIEAEEATYDVVSGTGVNRTFSAGHKFKLAKHHADHETGNTYVLTRVEHVAEISGEYTSGVGSSPINYQNQFLGIPEDVVARPKLKTPKARVQGVQTAVVVGPAGEEIYTDKFGRVKVQFHWDRVGQSDDKSSCWIRVAQLWAGKKWGAMFLPRIGHEVVVDFLEGDPDKPIIIGNVYNDANMPPYPLPDEKTKSGIKTNSSKGGSGFNELRFEDLKDKEQIFMHAQKDLDIRVLNDRYENILRDRHLTVDRDRIDHIKQDHSEIVDRDHNEKVVRDRHTLIEGKQNEEIKKTMSLKVGDSVMEDIAKDISTKVGNNCSLQADQISIEGKTNITLYVGSSYIAISKQGIKIATTGDIVLDAKKNITGKGGMNVKLDGGIGFEGKGKATAKLQATGMTEVKGGIVKIN